MKYLIILFLALAFSSSVSAEEKMGWDDVFKYYASQSVEMDRFAMDSFSSLSSDLTEEEISNDVNKLIYSSQFSKVLYYACKDYLDIETHENLFKMTILETLTRYFTIISFVGEFSVDDFLAEMKNRNPDIMLSWMNSDRQQSCEVMGLRANMEF